LKSGRYFSNDHPSDTLAVVLNEAALHMFVFKDPVGKHIADPTGSPIYEIIGIIKDFNFQSLHEAIQPLVIRFSRSNDYRYIRQLVSVRVASGDYRQTLAFLESAWKQFAADEPFDYDFLDQNLQNLYMVDQRTNRIVTSFSVLAISIACLGLFGLAAFVTEQRTKEIGIRKVLGASVMEVIALLSKEFIRWVVIANVIAWPLAYYVMNNWLENFAYMIDISFWIFAASGLFVMIIALLTVSSHAIKAATANPVESLRYE
jgi:putative ABC transport system permease protein